MSYCLLLLGWREAVEHLDFSVSMTTPAEANDVVEGVCELRIVELPYRCDMMNVRFMADFLSGDPAVLASVVVSFESFASDFSPLPIIGVIGVSPLLREPDPETVLTAKPHWFPFRFGFENGPNPPTDLTNAFHAFDIVNFVIR